MPSTRLPWSKLENDAAAVLRPALRKHLMAARAAHSTIRAALQMSATSTEGAGASARYVQARLLLRLSADLHLIEHASIRGYMLQALTLSATIHELAFAIGYIGTDDTRAASWEMHTKDYDTFPSLRQRTEAVRATLLALGMEGERLQEEVARLEGNYRFLCMARHGNPLLHKNWGVRKHNQLLSLLHGPFLSQQSTKQGKQILYAATELVWYACGVFLLAWHDTATRATRQRCLRHIRRLERLRWEARFYPSKPPRRAG